MKRSKEIALFKDLLIYNTSFNVDHISFLGFTFIHTELNFTAATLNTNQRTRNGRNQMASDETVAHQHPQCTTPFFFFYILQPHALPGTHTVRHVHRTLSHIHSHTNSFALKYLYTD